MGSGDEPAIPFADLGSILRLHRSCHDASSRLWLPCPHLNALNIFQCFKKDLVPSGRVNG